MSFSYYTPDQTGADPDYLVNDDVRYLFRTGQVVDLRVPIFMSSLSLAVVGSGQALVYGTDYSISQSDWDDDAMSQAKNVDPTFSATLIKSFTIIRPSGLLPVQVQLTYQQYYLTTPNVPISGADGGVEVTPELIISALNDIAALKQAQVQITNATAPTAATPVLLDYDINGTNSANVVSGEVHQVNTYNGLNYIRPINGAFFRDSLSLTITGASAPLVAGTDYTVAKCDVALTKATTNASGIYNLIQIITPTTDPVEVTYHAVGGTPSTQSVASIYDTISSVVNYLDGANFMTEAGLKVSPTVNTILRSINRLEANVRQLLSVPSYGDSTNSTSVVKALRTSDYNLHWWTVGSLYKVSGASDLITADRMKLRVQLVGAKYQCDLGVAVDTTNTRNPVTFTVEDVIWDGGMSLYGPLTSIAPMVPMVRVIWRASTTGISGALIQLGFALPGLTDQLALEDYSGTESAWLLDRTISTGSPLLPSDTNITLPDGSVWSTTDTTCQQVVSVLKAPAGHILLGGATPFTSFDSSATVALTPMGLYLPSYTTLASFSSVDVHVTNAAGLRLAYNLKLVPSADGKTLTAAGTVILDTTTDTQGTMILTFDTVGWTVTPKILGLTSIGDQFQLRYIVGKM